MKILGYLFAMLATCGLSGILLLIFLRCENEIRKLCFPIGYAYTLIAFYSFYMVLGSADAACILTVLFPLLCGALALVIHKKNLTENDRPRFQFRHFISYIKCPDLQNSLYISLIVLVISSWPYLLSGIGNYWHSGNYDMEDGLNGRDAYLNNLILESNNFDLGNVIGDKSWYDFAKVTGTLAKKAKAVDSYREWYAGDGFRLQYSSLAFWSVLLDLRHGLDVFLIQAILNLIVMTVGIYYLCRFTFCMMPQEAALAAGASVLSSFYLTTYFAGHEGSLIYGSLIPALLSLTLPSSEKKDNPFKRVLLIAIILLAILFAYPHPLVLIMFPILFHNLMGSMSVKEASNRITKAVKNNPLISGIFVAFLLCFFVVTAIFLWEATSVYRIRSSEQYRAWGYTHDLMILPLFLGLINSPLDGTSFLGANLEKYAYLGIVMLSSVFTVYLAFCFLKSKLEQNYQFFPIFGALWIIGYSLFFFYIADSYYLYKYMYVHQFIFIIGIVSSIYNSKFKWPKFVGGILLLANLKCNYLLAENIYLRPYNQDHMRFKNLLQFDRDLLEKSFIELTGGDATAMRQTLKAHGIQTTTDPRFAEYFILPKNRESDITGNQFKKNVNTTKEFVMSEAPLSNYLMIRAWNEPEYAPKDLILGNNAFRWVGQNKNDNLGIYIIRPSDPKLMKGKFLRLCFQAGPSSPHTIPVTISAAGKNILCKSELFGNLVRCVWIPAESVLAAQNQPLVVRSGATGKSLLPHDDRILLYRVFSVGWTDTEYDEKALSFFNLDDDITMNIVPAVQTDTKIKLGQGWETLETFAGERFRWAGGKTDLVLIGNDKDETVEVSIDLEPGPSLGQRSLVLKVIDSEGRKIMETPKIKERSKVRFSVGCQKKHNTVVTLLVDSENLAIPNDKRILNYRVFQVSLNQKNKNSL